MAVKFSPETLAHDNLGEVVYGKLSEALVKGQLEPNARLTIRDLAQALGTSVTPVRDAILRLIQDEALVQRSTRDVRVPILSPQRYREIRTIRMKLEGLAARESALKAGAADIARLRGLIERNEAAISEQDWVLGLECNQIFHFALAEIADMPVMRRVLSRLWLQMGPVIAGVYPTGGRKMIGRHYDVLAAIEARDPDAAEMAIVDDIGEAGALIEASLATRQAS